MYNLYNILYNISNHYTNLLTALGKTTQTNCICVVFPNAVSKFI